MATIVNYKGLSYDDIGIVPSAPSKVLSRSEIPLEGYRIVVAGMTSIIMKTLNHYFENIQ